MKNIELKIKVNDFKEIEKFLKVSGAKYYNALNQKDIYFNCARGRLKIREINNKNFELIFYRRPDSLINKLSNYSIMPINRAQLKQFKNILVLSAGIKVVVFKNRKLWLFKNTRIHLDNVDKLGKFLELETVLGRISKAEGEKEYLEIYNLLKLSRFEKIDKSYSDLLLK
ncbi:MAG: class IV adenylate cyclase [bacterium]|nr:class IV adenylate cyclase [bacterium]